MPYARFEMPRCEAGPIDDAEHNRLADAEKHDAERLERIIDAADRLNPPAAERVIFGRRHVAFKGREMEGRHGFTRGADSSQSHPNSSEKQQGDCRLFGMIW